MYNELLKNYKQLVSFDLETNGLHAGEDQIIEFGATVVTKDGITEYDYLVHTDLGISKKIEDITHINNYMIEKDGITQSELFELIKGFFDDDSLLIAYNIQFDIQFIMALFGNDWVPKCDMLDVMAIYRDKHIKPHKLDNLVKAYGVSVPNTHRALDDVKAMDEGLLKMNQRFGDAINYINYIGYHSYWGVNGPRLPHLTYVSQYKDGAKREIERRIKDDNKGISK